MSKRDREIIRKEIVKVLANSRFPLTTNEIAEITGRSWDFTRKNLTYLSNRGVVEKARRKNADYWLIRY
jgi:predicted transcriptional regulator